MAKILVIDDSLFQRRSIHKILAVDGHEIQEAEMDVKDWKYLRYPLWTVLCWIFSCLT